MMLRKEYEQYEMESLSARAMKSAESRGRIHEENKCNLRTEYQRDRDRILHSKSFRRLKHKTQVFLSPEGDHYRTRLTHTLEVSQISRTIARALRLNEDLVEAIALGHDLGHTPFGHAGEHELEEIHEGGFSHSSQSLRVVDFLENNERKIFRGLNLTMEVRDGILNHNGPVKPYTLEGQIVKICDRIAYINHDIDDAIRGGILDEKDIPAHLFEVLGNTHSERINRMIMDMIESSVSSEEIRMSDEVSDATSELRRFMFKNVYLNQSAKKEEIRARKVVRMLYEYFTENPSEMPPEYYEDYLDSEGADAIKDYIAGMTDRYATKVFEDKYIPKFWE